MDAYHETMALPKATVDKMEALCRTAARGCHRDDVVFGKGVSFDDGNTMEIQVVASGDPEHETCWTQGVLFDADGAEIGCTEPGDTFAGEYCVETDTATYTVVVTDDSDASLLREAAAALESFADTCGNDDEMAADAARAADMAMRLRAMVPERLAIVVAGDLWSGFRFIGPFPSWDDASDHADANVDGTSWIATLEPPASK
jgi:hypothetical protein